MRFNWGADARASEGLDESSIAASPRSTPNLRSSRQGMLLGLP
jgi:hypothetical protein